VGNQVDLTLAIPVPEPGDLPKFFKFMGWYPIDGLRPGWFAYFGYFNPTFPPIQQQIIIFHDQMSKLSENQRIKLVVAEMSRIIEETKQSMRVLGWDVDFGYEVPKKQDWS
jgi:hypothetical protein